MALILTSTLKSCVLSASLALVLWPMNRHLFALLKYSSEGTRSMILRLQL